LEDGAILIKGRDRVFPLETVEQALDGLRDVKTAKVVPDSAGGILAVHVITTSDRPGKQIARDVESVLVAKLGIAIDHRKISVAQVDAETAESPERPPEAAGETEAPGPPEAVPPPPAPSLETQPEPPAPDLAPPKDGRRIEFIGVSVAQSQLKAEARVELAMGEVNTVAVAGGADTSLSVQRLVAEATLQAVQQFFENGSVFAVVAVEQATVGGKHVVVVDVSHLAERHEKTLLGACPLNGGDVPRATALATLDAVNRYLRRLKLKEPVEYIVGPASGS